MQPEFYDLQNVSFADRESFNNAIWLLSMIKNEYFYIIGFSRPKGIIRIGFTYSSDLHSEISETLTIDFVSDRAKLIIACDLSNVEADRMVNSNSLFTKTETGVGYIHSFDKDLLVPFCAEALLNIVKQVIEEVKTYNENYYKLILSGESL